VVRQDACGFSEVAEAYKDRIMNELQWLEEGEKFVE
jgi:hypothetical protein